MSALAELFAKKQVAGTLSGPIPDVVKPDLAAEVAKLQAEAQAPLTITGDTTVQAAPQTKVATDDPGVAVKVSAPTVAPHVEAATDTSGTEATAQ